MEGCRAEVERGDEREEKQVESLQVAYTREPEKLYEEKKWVLLR